MSDLPSGRCPRCDSRRVPIEWGRDVLDGLRTVLKCQDCGATWWQVGRQESLDLGETAPTLALE